MVGEFCHFPTSHYSNFAEFCRLCNGPKLVVPVGMARRPRLQFLGARYHVMSRGNRKLPIFEDDDDRETFLSSLARTVARYDIKCYAFCLMSNHYHCVLETPRGNLSAAMKHLNGCYTQAFNRRHQRPGHVFEGRFKSILVDNDSYFQDVCKYVVLNPVRAHLVTDPSIWQWSSYRATAGLGPAAEFLVVDWIDLVFEGRSREESQGRYRLFVNDDVAKASCLDSESLVEGSPEFETAVREYIGVKMHLAEVPRAYRALGRPTLEQLFGDPALALPQRNELMRRAHVVHGYRLAEIASFLGLHRSTPSAIVNRLRVSSRRGT